MSYIVFYISIALSVIFVIISLCAWIKCWFGISIEEQESMRILDKIFRIHPNKISSFLFIMIIPGLNILLLIMIGLGYICEMFDKH